VEGGSTWPTPCGSFQVSTISPPIGRAGETGGILDIILQRLAAYVEKAVKLRSAVKSALIYPVAVVSMAVLIVGALLKWVVPIFANLFAGLGVSLPLPTRIVMGLSAFVGQFWWFFIVGAVGLVVGSSTSEKTHGQILDGLRNVEDADYRYSAAEDRGSPVHPDAGNSDHFGRANSRGLEHHGTNLGQRGPGRSADESAQSHRRRPAPSWIRCGECGVFPNMVTQMIGVGEATGAMDNMLQKIADFYEDEVDSATKDMLACWSR